MAYLSHLIGEQYSETYVHEMAHIYTLTNDLAARPGPLGIAHLYFVFLAQESDSEYKYNCLEREIYAETLSELVIPRTGVRLVDNWLESMLSRIVRGPTEEAMRVAEQALNGQIPDWLYETYQDKDGNLDLEAFWVDFQKTKREYTAFRLSIKYRLRDVFGGYCSPSAIMRGTWYLSVRNPWRDGGCVPQAPQSVTATSGDGSAVISWQPPAYDGGHDIINYVIQWKDGDQDYHASRQLMTASDAHSARIMGLDSGVDYTARVIAVNNRIDNDNPSNTQEGMG